MPLPIKHTNRKKARTKVVAGRLRPVTELILAQQLNRTRRKQVNAWRLLNLMVVASRLRPTLPAR